MSTAQRNCRVEFSSNLRAPHWEYCGVSVVGHCAWLGWAYAWELVKVIWHDESTRQGLRGGLIASLSIMHGP